MRKILLPLIFSLTAFLGLHAQSDNDAIYIYRNDGQFNAFFDARVDSITCSHYDADSIWHSDWQMQVVYTSDSIYRIPLAVIDSVTFAAPAPVEKFFIYENLGSFNWTYLVFEDTENVLLVNDDGGKFVSSYGISSGDTVYILSDLIEGTLSIDVNGDVVELICNSDSIIAYSKDGRKVYSLRGALSRTRTVSNGDMLNVLFGNVIGEIIPDAISKPIELMKYLYETDDMNHREKIDYILDGDYELIPSDWLDALFDRADTKEDNHKSTPIYYIGIKTGTADVKGSSATCFVDGYLRVDGNGAAYDFEYGICYSTSSVPTVNDKVLSKREANGMVSSLNVSLPTPFVCSNLESETTYYYRAYFKDNLTGMVDYADETKEFTTKGICDDANHVHAVDLGLSVKWACCNVGASVPEGYGGYYAWGETEEKSSYDWDTYQYYIDTDGDGWQDTWQNLGSNISGTSYDVARMKWGGGWRMPTLDEIKELCEKCSWEWTSVNGVNGQKVTGPNGNSIFLPAAGSRNGSGVYTRGSFGRYWSGTPGGDGTNGAGGLDFGSGCGRWDDWLNRGSGFTVRPVTDK